MKKLLLSIILLALAIPAGMILKGAFTGSLVTEVSESCNWSCTEWSGCSDGIQTRICTRPYSCGALEFRPEESRPCGYNCTEDWACTGWSACLPGNRKVRVCADRNNCGTETGRPAEAKDCA